MEVEQFAELAGFDTIVSRSVAAPAMASPSVAVFAATVLATSETELPLLAIALPVIAVLPLMVLLRIPTVPEVAVMPPPLFAVLPLSVLRAMDKALLLK